MQGTDAKVTGTCASPARGTCTRLMSRTLFASNYHQELQFQKNWLLRVETPDSVDQYCNLFVCCGRQANFSIIHSEQVVINKTLAECAAGFQRDAESNCTACTGDTYKSDIGDTACLSLPPGTSVPEDLVVEGGNTGFSKHTSFSENPSCAKFLCSSNKIRLHDTVFHVKRGVASGKRAQEAAGTWLSSLRMQRGVREGGRRSLLLGLHRLHVQT